MPMIPVLNPPRKRRRAARKKKRGMQVARKKRRKKRPARRKARKAAPKKAAPPKRKRRRGRRRKARKIGQGLGEGVHRPVIRVKSGRLYRGAAKKKSRSRSRMRPHQTFVNPYLGEIMTIGNPRRRSRRRSYRNPAALSIRGVTGAVKGIASVSFAQEAAFAAVGFLGTKAIMTQLPAVLVDQPWKQIASQVGVVAGMSVVASKFVSRKAGRLIALGGGMGIALDLYAQFVLPLLGDMGGGASSGTSTYYGTDDDSGVADAGMGAYYGTDDDSGVASSLADTF